MSRGHLDFFRFIALFSIGQISREESLFYYKAGENVEMFSVPDHVPSFADELLQQATRQQQDLCNDDPSCLFDLLETNDPSIALGTLRSAQNVAAATASMGKATSFNFASLFFNQFI